jgi:probable rRNA maturation factor
LKICIFYDETNFRLKGWRRLVNTIEKVIRDANKVSGDLSFIITNDRELRKINLNFLEHDYNTDVITFSNSVEDIISGEVYISIETVKKNAKAYKVKLLEEVKRVMFHGLLHLLGYDDVTENLQKKMVQMEEYCLELEEEYKNGF